MIFFESVWSNIAATVFHARHCIVQRLLTMPPRCLPLSRTLVEPSSFVLTPQSTSRTFTTTALLFAGDALRRRKGGDLGSHLPKYVIPQDVKIPEYPYGAAQLFKQSDGGLYGGKSIQFGNNVSSKTETKTRRYWKPNILSKSLYSIALSKRIKLRVAASVLKTIDREGGLDEYLLKQSDSRIKEIGPTGWALRWTLLQKPSVVRRMRKDALALGVPLEEVDAQWPKLSPESAEASKRAEDAPIKTPTKSKEIAVALSEETKAEKAAHHLKKQIEREATKTYKTTVRAANRYLKRGVVDDMQQGIKIICLREQSRAEKRERNEAMYKARLEAEVGHPFKDKKSFRRAIQSHNEKIKKDIVDAGGYEAYRNKLNPDAAARYSKFLEEHGGEEAYKAKLKGAVLKEIKDAENAITDKSVPEEERQRIQTAFEKAQGIIDARHSLPYSRKALARWEGEHADEWPLNSVSKEEGLGESWREAQEWDALVKKSPDSRPRA